MSRWQVNGVGLNVVEAGAGWPLVLLHGFTGSALSWQSQIETFKATNRVIALDLLGHGSSDSPTDPQRYSLDRASDDLAGLLDELDLAKVALLGYSLGGRLALNFAVSYPHRVSRLILESASPGLATATERAERAQADATLADFIEREGLAAFVARWESLPLFDSQRTLPASVQAAQRRQRLANRPDGLANSLRGAGTGTQISLWQSLDTLAIPTLLLAGELDPKFVAIARQMHQHLPASRLEIVGGAGHTVHLEQPAAFEGLVLSFLQQEAQGKGKK